MKVLIMQSPDGCIEVVTEGECEVVVVCDHVPKDRLYRLSSSHTVSAARVAEIIGDDDIGSSSDERHAAIENRIHSALAGKPHLKPVN